MRSRHWRVNASLLNTGMTMETSGCLWLLTRVGSPRTVLLRPGAADQGETSQPPSLDRHTVRLLFPAPVKSPRTGASEDDPHTCWMKPRLDRERNHVPLLLRRTATSAL